MKQDAEDVVQEASLRALRYFRTFSGGNGRAWFLRIVRNTCWSWRGHSVQPLSDPFDEEQHSGDRSASDPETLLLQTDDVTSIERAMRNLPDRFRELLVLVSSKACRTASWRMRWVSRWGTVMSSLSRARQAFRAALNNQLPRVGHPAGPGIRGEQEGQNAALVWTASNGRRQWLRRVGASADERRAAVKPEFEFRRNTSHEEQQHEQATDQPEASAHCAITAPRPGVRRSRCR
jgi:RNA polymerase sigma-70 factor (ECF subfamily)